MKTRIGRLPEGSVSDRDRLIVMWILERYTGREIRRMLQEKGGGMTGVNISKIKRKIFQLAAEQGDSAFPTDMEAWAAAGLGWF